MKKMNTPLEFETFPFVYITNSGIALRNLCLVKASVFSNVPSFYFYKYAVFKRFTEPKIKIEGANNLLIHNHWSSGYHHWITESLVRLLSINTKEYNLIIPIDYPKFAFEILSTYSFKSIIKIPAKTGVFASNITIPFNPDSGFYEKDKLHAIKAHFLNYYNIPDSVPTSRIYITRKNAAKRKVENEKELLPILEKFGFVVIDADQLTVLEQIKLFSSCSILISIHGAALTNCIFMNENTTVLEFYKKNTFINYCYERMTKELHINYARLLCDGGTNNTTHVDVTDLIVNIDDFEKVLNKL